MPALETNRFFTVARVLLRARRQPTGGKVSLSSDSSTSQIIDELKRLGARVEELEANRPQPWSEFEFDVTAGGTHRIEHGYGCPVRYYITNWVGAAAPSLSKSTASTNDVLVLSSLNAGRAVIRIEKSQYGLS